MRSDRSAKDCSTRPTRPALAPCLSSRAHKRVVIPLRPRDPAAAYAARWEELAMLDIIRANIDRFKTLLETETDSTKRAMETRLLAEEEAKLKLTFLTRHSRLLP